MSFVTMTEKKLTTAFVKGKASALLEEGLSERHVSRRLGIPRKTIALWRANAFRLCRNVGSGRKRKTCSRSDRLILRRVKEDPTLSSREVRNSLPEPTISARTVRRRLREGNFKSRKRPSTLELTDRQARATRLGNAALPLALSMGSSRLD